MTERLSDWLFEKTLPFWVKRGVDRQGGGFHEGLDAHRAPVTAEGKRVMVQARQFYTFTQADRLHRLPGAADAAKVGLDFLIDHYRHPNGGWRFRVRRDGRPLEDARDLYAQAFVLFALAWRCRIDPTGPAAAEADSTMAFIDGEMAHPAGGYHESIGPDGFPSDGERRQNPHMHLFEACLAWIEAGGGDVWRNRAQRLADLLENRFVVDGTLRERFTPDLDPAAGKAGRHVEPGHHFEWSWLLDRYGAATGETRYAGLAASLYAFALEHGIAPDTGAVADAVDCDGVIMDGGHRIWPQAEAIKAHSARFAATGDRRHADERDRRIDALFTLHFDGAAAGAWREHVESDGRIRVSALPASTLYHLTGATAELRKATEPGAAS